MERARKDHASFFSACAGGEPHDSAAVDGYARTVAMLAPAANPGDGPPDITRHAVGDGVAYGYAFYPG